MFVDKPNLKPALVVLYSLALLQGVLFYYCNISAFWEKGLVRRVAQAYKLDDEDQAIESVSHYMREIRVGCEKDPSCQGQELCHLRCGSDGVQLFRKLPLGGKDSGHDYPAVDSSRGEGRADNQHGCVVSSIWRRQVRRDKCYSHKIISRLANDEENFKHMSKMDGITHKIVAVIVGSRYRRSAADILKHLCVHCNCEDTNSENLKQAMIREIPEVLKEVLRGSREQQNDHYLRTNYVKVQEALASLCATVHEKLISTYPDLIEKFNTEEATNICRAISKNPSGVSFADLVTEAKNVVEDYRKRLDLAFFIF
ncbi:hypothetical protein HU200_040936 [Digitaria exilis]|uniref:Uncharacterized protein n=1 Tax=Digitaria exilis TaxID=1010633 RepID=A0A835EE23_9POAL|nr:hypothetical protein HU200_040936 [Digitaria exilis]